MKLFNTIAVVVASLALLCACDKPPAARSVPLSASAQAEAGSFAVGALCSVGSFECEVTPSYARIAVIVHSATAAYRKGLLSTDQLQTVVDRGRAAVDKLDGVMTTCKQDSRSGRCRGSEASAREQLASAKRDIDHLN